MIKTIKKQNARIQQMHAKETGNDNACMKNEEDFCKETVTTSHNSALLLNRPEYAEKVEVEEQEKVSELKKKMLETEQAYSQKLLDLTNELKE